MKRLTESLRGLLLLLVLLAAAACDEVEQATKYDNWRERNEAFADSLHTLAADRYVATAAQADEAPLNTLFAVQVFASSTTEAAQYVYCKKMNACPEGRRPLYTETVAVFYYGTLINGDRFDGNFTGYPATWQTPFDPEARTPQPTDSPTEFGVTGVVAGWTAVLQLMRTGERWMVWIPYPSAYGTTDSGSIPGYSLLAFDMQLQDVTGE